MVGFVARQHHRLEPPFTARALWALKVIHLLGEYFVRKAEELQTHLFLLVITVPMWSSVCRDGSVGNVFTTQACKTTF